MTEAKCPTCGAAWVRMRNSVKPYSLAPIKTFACGAGHEWNLEAV